MISQNQSWPRIILWLYSVSLFVILGSAIVMDNFYSLLFDLSGWVCLFSIMLIISGFCYSVTRLLIDRIKGRRPTYIKGLAVAIGFTLVLAIGIAFYLYLNILNVAPGLNY